MIARLALGLAALLAGGALAAQKADPLRWWAPGSNRVFPAKLDYDNGSGTLRTLLTGGPMATRGHPFFTPVGPSGRACITCQQPADAMTFRPRRGARGGMPPAARIRCSPPMTDRTARRCRRASAPRTRCCSITA
jgi:hypothetical protein